MKRKAEEMAEEETVSTPAVKSYTNRQRLLVISSRGVTARFRHLQEDIKLLTPHHKTDSKLDAKGDVASVVEIAEFKSCNQIMYFECKKHQGKVFWDQRPGLKAQTCSCTSGRLR